MADEQETFRLQRRTPQEQVDWLIQEHSLLAARVQVLEREVAELRTRRSGKAIPSPWTVSDKLRIIEHKLDDIIVKLSG